MDRRRAAGALLALAACIASSAAAPTLSNQTALDLYDAATEGCYYNFQHYGEGDRIMTNEPCLNCTCHNRMLMCYLRVCPFTKPIGQDCTVEKRADQCCPIVTCPDVPVDLLTSTSTSSPAEYGGTGVGKLDKYGCSIDGKYFSEGSKVPPTPNKPCEHCYCIRNMTTCVMQECTLHVDGCTPIYHKDVCCPVRYSCDHPEDELLSLDDMSTTVRPTPGFLLTTTTVSPVTQVTQDCVHNDQIFADGTSIKTEKACEHCYCMKGDIVCVVQECGTPMENEGKNCTSQPPREGQCCPDTYICEGDELTTELPFDLLTQSPQEELTTLSPPRRTEVEGSGYRNEPDEPLHTDMPVVEPEVEGSGDDFVTMQPLDGSEKYTPGIMDDTFASTEDQGFGTTKLPIEGEKITVEPDSELNTVPSGASESSIPKLTTLAEETKTSDEQQQLTTLYEHSTTLLDNLRTTKESVLHTTESSFRKEDELHVPTDTPTQKIQDEYTTLETPTKENYEDKEELVPTIEDDTKITKPSLTDDTQTITTELPASAPSDISEPVKETSQPSEHTVSEIETTTEFSEKTDTTAVDAYENEIEDHSTPQGAGRIPGEGDCLQAGITYRNDSSVPSTNNCQTDCKCISSIIKCDPIICSPPPEYMSNCVPTYDSSESCCPTYVCDESKETLPPQPHSQMSETESSTSTPTFECSDDQCAMQDHKTPAVPVCTSQDCLTKPIETSQTSECETENCKGVEQVPIQPDVQTDCGPTGCDGKIEAGEHEPLPVPPESCTEAECKQEAPCEGENCKGVEQVPIQPDVQTDCGPTGCDGKIEAGEHEPLPVPPESCTEAECKQEAPCEGENCKIGPTETCQNEEDCKNIQDIPKTDTCEGDSCKEIPIDCGVTGCDVSPPIQQAPEICNNEECQKPEQIAPECTDDNCRRKDTPDVEGKIPTECTDPNCGQEKPASPELSVPESVTTEKMLDISVTEELQKEVTLPPKTKDQESGMQTELPHEEGTQAPQTPMDSFATESSSNIPKLTEMTTNVPELTKEETSSGTVEIKQTSELPITALHDITTDLSDTNIITTQPHEKITTTSQPILEESHTSTPHETLEDVTETSVKITSKDQEEESSVGTEVGDFVTKIPETFTSEQYDHSTQAQEEITTKQEDAKVPVETEQQLTTQSVIKDETDLEKQTDQEVITKLPVLASETTAIIPEKEPIPTSSQQSEPTEKSELPEVPEIYHSVEYPSVTQPASDIEEKVSTEYPSILDENTEAVTETADMVHASAATEPSKLDEKMTTITSEITEFSYGPQTTLSLQEPEHETKPQEEEVDTKKPDIHTPETEPSATISPELYSTDKVFEQSTAIKEEELTETSGAPEEKEQFTTITPSISLEPELETKTPDLDEMPVKTETPLGSDEISKDKLPEQLGDTEQPEIDTEEPSIQEEPGVTEHEEFSPESPVEPEVPVYIPVYPSIIEEKDKTEQDKETPISEVSPETIPEYISSTTQKLEITTLQPDVVTQAHVTEKDYTTVTEFDKSDEIPQSPYSKVPDLDITEAHTEQESAITSTRTEAPETVTEFKLTGTEEEDIIKTTETPESHVKDIEEKTPPTIPKVTDVDTTEKQVPIDKFQTESPVFVIPETAATVLPVSGQEEDLSTKTQKPELEIEEAVSKISDETTEQYDHSETLPDMIELVEHHPVSDISTEPPTSDEVVTISDNKLSTMYTDMQEIDKEHKFDDTLTTLKPMIPETEYKPTPEEIEVKTKSPEESTSVQSATQGYEHTVDGEVTTEQPVAEIDHAVTADEKMETEPPKVPAIEQPTITEKETLPDREDASDIEPERIPTQESSTEKSDTTVDEQKEILEEKPLTEKPETPIVEHDITGLEEFVTEREMTPESESITEKIETFETEHTIEPEKELHVEPSEIPGMEIEQEITTETPAAAANEPETSTSRHEIAPEKPSEEGQEVISQEEYTTKGSEIPITEYVIPDQESITERELEEESVTAKTSSTEEIIGIEHKVTPEKETETSKTESPTTETKTTSSQESVTNAPEGIEHELESDLTTPSITEQEMKPVEEHSITEQDIMHTEGDVKPDEKLSTIAPDISEMEHEEKPDKEPAAIPEIPVIEQKPDAESSTIPHEIPDIEKEEKPEIDLATEQTDKPEMDHDVTPGIKHPEPATELTESSEAITRVPEFTTSEFEAMPDEATEKTEISVGHEGTPEQGSMTKEPESTLVDQDVSLGPEQVTKEPTSPEMGHEETPHKEATEQPEITELLPEILPEQESATLKPEIPVSDHEITIDQEPSTKEPEIPKLEDKMKPDKESSTEHIEPTEKDDEISTEPEPSRKPDIELQSPVEESQIPEIEPQHPTEPSEVPVTKPQSTEPSELPEIESQHSTEPSAIPEIKPQDSTEPSEIFEMEPQSSTDLPEMPGIEPQYTTEQTEEPNIPQSSTEHLKEQEFEPQPSTERLAEPEIKPQFTTERLDVPEIEPQFTTERLDVPEIEPQHTVQPSEIPESEPQSSSEQSEIPEIEPQLSTQQPEVSETELQSSSEVPVSEIDKEDSTEKIEPQHEMTPILESIKPTVESDADNELIPDKDTTTEKSKLPEIEHEIMPSTERSDTTESEVKPIDGSSTERTETTESESKEPEIAITEHDVEELETSTRLPETSEVEHETKPVIAFTTERSETPETPDRFTTMLPSEDDHTKSKPIEEEISVKTTTETVYETTIAVDKELPEKSTEPSETITASPEVQEDIVKKDEDLEVLSTTSKYPSTEAPTTSVSSDLEKIPVLETGAPVQTERETEKPTESKDTTAPEEEFLTVTTKATTPKTEDVISTQSPSFDKFTKPHDRPESDLLPSSVAPEIPKPGFNEVQATDEIPSPEDDGHFAPSATGGYGGQETDYEDENQPFGPGTCRYGGKVYVSAQQIPRDDPCDFCFCFRSDIICLQQSCPPPIHGCHEEPIQGFCCPRYECPVSMANTLNITTTTTTTTTTLPPHFNLNAYHGAAQRRGCQIKGHTYKVGEVVRASSGPCLHCTCGGDGQMKCDPKACTPEPMLRQMIAAAVSAKRRR